MKIECELCGLFFESTELECENIDGLIQVTCPSGCVLIDFDIVSYCPDIAVR